MLTFSKLDELKAAEMERVAFRAQQGEGGEADGARKKRKTTGMSSVTGVEVAGAEAFGGVRLSAADSIDLDYILWGHTQRIQLAGLRGSGALARSLHCRSKRSSLLCRVVSQVVVGMFVEGLTGELNTRALVGLGKWV